MARHDVKPFLSWLKSSLGSTVQHTAKLRLDGNILDVPCSAIPFRDADVARDACLELLCSIEASAILVDMVAPATIWCHELGLALILVAICF